MHVHMCVHMCTWCAGTPTGPDDEGKSGHRSVRFTAPQTLTFNKHESPSAARAAVPAAAGGGGGGGRRHAGGGPDAAYCHGGDGGGGGAERDGDGAFVAHLHDGRGAAPSGWL